MDPSQSPARLWSRDFRLVWAMTFLTFFAAFQLFPTVPLRLLALGATKAESGRFMTVFTFGSSLGALLTGPLGDRVGHRRLLVACAFGFAGCLVLHGLLATRAGFYLLAFPHGVLWSGVLTGTMATLGRVLPDTRRADGLAVYGLASPSGAIFGPAVGLWIFDRAGFSAMAWMLAGLFGVLALLATGLPGSPGPEGRAPSSLRLPDRAVLAPCAVLFGLALGYGALGTYTAQEARELGFALPSAFLSAMAAGMVLMRVLMARRGFGRRPIRRLPAMLGLAFAGLAALAFWPGGLGRHLVSALAYGAGYSMVHTLLNAHLLETVPPERRGAAFGALLFAFDAGIGLGAFLLGWVIGHAGYTAGWAAGACCVLAVIPVGLRMARR